MPNIQAARKALRQAKKRTEWNRARKDAFKNAVKKVLHAKTADEAKELMRLAQKALDKAAKHGTIKKNTAARRLSRLAQKIRMKLKSA